MTNIKLNISKKEIEEKNIFIKNLLNSHYGDKEKCSSCNQNNEAFMLKHELWKKVCFKLKINERNLICLSCVNKALNRNLRFEDFLEDAPINYGIFYFDLIKFIPLQEEYYKIKSL